MYLLTLSDKFFPNYKLKLMPVITSFTLSDGVLQSHLVSSFLDFALSKIPILRITSILLFIVIPVGESDIHRHAECLKDQLGQLNRIFNLLLELLVRAVDMGVVLGKTANPGESAKFPGLLIPVNGTKLSKPKRKVAITP